MAKKELALEINLDSKEAIQSAKNLKQQFTEVEDKLFELAGAGKRNTAEFKKAQLEAAALKQEIDNINTSLDTLKPEAIGAAFSNVANGLASGFAGAQGAMALFGAEGEDLQKTLVKVQSAMAIAEGINGLKGLKKGFQLLGDVIKANPILLIASIIISIGTALFALKDKIKIIGVYFDLLGAVIDTVVQAGKDFLDWIGLSTFAAEEQAEAIIASAKKQQEALTQRYDDEIAMAKAAGKNTFELEQKKQVAILQSAKTQIEALKSVAKSQGKWTEEQLTQLNELGKVIHDASIQIKINNITQQKEETDKQKDAYNERLKDTDEYNKKMFAYAQARADAINKEADAYDAMRKKQKEQQKAAKEQGQKDAEEIAANMIKEMNDAALIEAEINQIKNQNSLDSQIAYLTTKRDIELQNEKLTADEKLRINAEYEKNVSDLKTANFQQQLQLTQQAIAATQALTDLAFDHQLRQAAGNAKKEKEIKKKQFQVNKAFSVAQIILNTIMGITQAISSSPPPLSWVLAGINSAMGTAATIKALTTKFDDGGASGGMGGIAMGGNIGAAGGGVNVAPPSTNSTLLNADGSIKKQQGMSQPTVKAIVTETDITQTQKRVNSIEETSKIK